MRYPYPILHCKFMLSVAVGLEQFVFTVSILLQPGNYYCCDPKARGANGQSFVLWQ